MNLGKIKEGLSFIKSAVESKNEFEASLKDHQVKETDIYRLRYINYYRRDNEDIGMVDWPFDCFKLPENMNREDAFKILSYLTDYIEKIKNLQPCSKMSVSYLNDILNIERLGFKKVDNIINEEITDLFTINGRVLLFKKSNEYLKYFEWYTYGISLDDVQYIYAKYGMDFCDLNLGDIDEQLENRVRSLK